jgi:VWFA-related protein
MVRKILLLILIFLAFILRGPAGSQAQESPNFQVVVNMVQLNVAVTDKKGNYITGLRPQDFAILEDGIAEKAATFAEGDEPARSLSDSADRDSVAAGPGGLSKRSSDGASDQSFASLVNGANVFVLFDTSDYMYRGFVFAQDAITEFIRSLSTADKIAFYSYSRDISRTAALTSDRSQILRAVRSTVAGDQAALYNALLLTLKDAA